MSLFPIFVFSRYEKMREKKEYRNDETYNNQKFLKFMFKRSVIHTKILEHYNIFFNFT